MGDHDGPLQMKGIHVSRNIVVLGGIGLVIAGLLAGILIMLFVVEPRTVVVEPAARASVETIQLGRRDDFRPVMDPDSSRPLSITEVQGLNQLFKQVSSQVVPSVVYIQVDIPAEATSREWFHDFDGEQRDRLFRDRVPRQSVGSGVVISPAGHIVTNNHVIENATAITVTLSDKRQLPAEIVGTDHSTDMAILKVDVDEELPAVMFGDSETLTVGEWVLAVGNPFRLTSTVTAGIVSALGRQVNIIDDVFGIEDFIQTDAAINPGNSGGALVNLQGELVGINTAIATESGSYEGYGFAVPVNLMRRVAEDLIAYGEVRRGILGVTIREVVARQARQLGLDRVQGVYLEEVPSSGAAYRGGLRRGDVILSIDGRTVDAPNELQRRVAQYRPGDRLKVEVWRDGRLMKHEIELQGRDDPGFRNWLAELRGDNAAPQMPELEQKLPEEVPLPDPESAEMTAWGMGLRDLTTRELGSFEVPGGAYVAYLKKDSPTALAGLPMDVVITSIDGQSMNSAEEVVEYLESDALDSSNLLFQVKRRDGIHAFYEVGVPSE